MDTTCFHSTYYPTEDKSFTLKWNGADPGVFGCEINFDGKERPIFSTKYELCVEAQVFNIQRQGIRLLYITGFFKTTKRVY